MTQLRIVTILSTFASLSLISQPSDASIINDEVQATMSVTVAGLSGDITFNDFFNDPFNGALSPPATFSGSAATVTAGGPEFFARSVFLGEPSYDFEVDVNDGTIDIRITKNSAFAGVPTFSLTVSDFDWIGMPGTITNVSPITGGDLPIVSSFTADTISFQFTAPATLNQAAYLNSFTFEASHDQQPPNAVPEPSTFALLGIGGLVLVGYGWRRRSQAA